MGDELANDRTYLAWLRTGIALFGLGFVVAKVALIVQPDPKVLSDRGLYSGVGVLIVLSGAMLIVSVTSNMWPWLKSSSATKKHHGPGGR
jgi:putative membrane protein